MVPAACTTPVVRQSPPDRSCPQALSATAAAISSGINVFFIVRSSPHIKKSTVLIVRWIAFLHY